MQSLLFFHLLGMTVILGIFGSLQILKKQEDGEIAPPRAWALVAIAAATWPVWLSVVLVVTVLTYRLEGKVPARKPPE